MTYKQKINNLILNYFIQEGYQEAAITFAKETNVDLSDSNDKNNRLDPQSVLFLEKLHKANPTTNEEFFRLIRENVITKRPVDNNPGASTNAKICKGYSTIEQRKEIKNLILKGKVIQAIQKISEYFPSVLDSNNLLHFRLLRLNLIEMIRGHKLSDADRTGDEEKAFLESVLEFVRENLINKVTRSFKLLKELEITMSLLCFNFDNSATSIEKQKDLPEELRSLFDLSLRTQCYRLVNKAILGLNAADRAPNDDLADFEEEQRYYDKLKYNEADYHLDLSQLDTAQLEDIDDDNDKDAASEMELDYDNLTGISSKNTSQENLAEDENEEDENNKLQDLALESKLEKVVKLWTVTEQRLLDLHIIKEKRYDLNDEFL